MAEQAQGGVRSAGSWAFAALVGALVLVVLFLLGSAYRAWPGAYNSDHLYCSAVCEDFRLGRPLTGWYLPGAPYLFPDMAYVLPCQLLPGGVAGEFLGFLFATFLGLLAAVAWLGRAVGLTRRQALAGAASGVLLLTAVHLGTTYEGRGTHLASPGSHFGIVPVGIALVALAVGLLRRGPRPLPIALFLVFGALGGFSDKLLVVQFLAPLAAAVVLLALGRVVGVRAAAGLLGLVGGVVLLSSGLRLLAPRLGFHLLSIENTFGKVRPGDWRALLGQVRDGVREQPLLAVFMLLYLPAGALLVRAWLRRRGDQPAGTAPQIDRRAVLAAALTLALAPLCNLAAVYAAGLSQNPAIYRYILPCYVLPLLLTGWLLGLLPGRLARLGRVVIPTLAVLVAAWRVADRGPALATVPLDRPYPPLARVLDRLVRERGPLRGFGEFWAARQMHFLCREEVAIAPLDRFGMPFFHASRPGRFLADDPRDTSVPRFDFIVVRPACTFQDPGPELVSLLYGLPRERIPAGDHEVWLYDRLQSSPLDRFFRARIAERLRARDPGTGPASPGRLARPKANMSPINARGTISITKDGEVTARFAHPLTGKAIDVAAGHDEVFDLEFRAGDRSLARLHVPGVPFNGSAYEYPGMQARLLPLPESVQTEPFDRVVVRPRPGSAVHRGHFLVRAEDPPETGIGPSQRRPRVRLEAEWLPTFTTFVEDTLDASTRDPEASNGRVRQAPSNYHGLVTYTQFLSLPAGRYRIDFSLRAGGTASGEEVADIDALCFGPPAVLAARTLRASDFPAGGFVTHSLEFDLAEDTDFLVFRLSSQGKTTIALDYLDIVALPADASAGR
jgi:hypothetical protein